MTIRITPLPPHLRKAVLRDLAVSLVDGYDLPMSITNNVGCPVANCPVDLGPNCMCIVPHQSLSVE